MDLSQLDETRALLEAFPEKFANPAAAKETLKTLYERSGVNSAIGSTKESAIAAVEKGQELLNEASEVSKEIGEEAAMAAQAAKRGYEYLAKSETDNGFDPQFSGVCIPCQSREPCSMESGRVSDKNSSGRFVAWPLEVDSQGNYKTNLLMVAKDVKGSELATEVTIDWNKEECKNSNTMCATIALTKSSNPHYLSSKSDVAVSLHQNTLRYEVISLFLSEKFTLGLACFDWFYNINEYRNTTDFEAFTPNLCCIDADFGSIKVIPYPYVKLDGTIKASLIVSIRTGGVSISTGLDGNLTGQFGAFKIESANSVTAKGASAQELVSRDDHPKSIRDVLRIIKELKGYFDSSGDDRRVIENNTNTGMSQFSSGIDFFGSLELKTSALELAACSGSPDLELKFGEAAVVFTGGVKGTIDILDVIANIVLTPAGARVLQEGRTKIANGESFKGEIRAEINLSATGSLEFGLESGYKLLIKANNGGVEENAGGKEYKFNGKFRTLGQALIRLHAEARVWILSAGVGVEGSLNTSWVWERRKKKIGENYKLQKRYYFEGLKVQARAYKEISYRTNDDELDDLGVDLEGGIESDDTLIKNSSDIFVNDLQVSEVVENSIKISQGLADAVCGEAYQCPQIEGDWYEVLKPTKDPLEEEDLWEDA
ncbi:hypothetical protein [Neptunomonas phycophila]|uniref:hypothetical protein n=1 Tax=Neptunomonas phycophila TaxID=1572645 RepID=UPI003734F574